MLQIQDQVDSYILKYKEELFKNSSNSIKNQEIIEKLRAYFQTAAMQGDFELKKSLDRLMSPQSLAHKHLTEAGIKVIKRRGFLTYIFLISFFLLLFIFASMFTLFYLIFPMFESSFDSDVVSWEIKYEGDINPFSAKYETIQGNIPVNLQTRFYVDAKVINSQIKRTNENFIFYSCEFKEGEVPSSPLTESMQEQITFNLQGGSQARSCRFEIPQNMQFALEAEVANLEISPWSDALQIKVATGNIAISLDSSQTYDFNAYVERGNLQGVSDFRSSPDGKKIEVYVSQGNLKFIPY